MWRKSVAKRTAKKGLGALYYLKSKPEPKFAKKIIKLEYRKQDFGIEETSGFLKGIKKFLLLNINDIFRMSCAHVQESRLALLLINEKGASM